MRRGSVVVVGLILFVLSPAPSLAQMNYVGLEIGPVSLSDTTISVPGVGSAEMSTDTGFGIAAKLGHRVAPFRIEGELAIKVNELDRLSGPGGIFPLDGDFSSVAGMINGYFDLPTGGPVAPFVGVGVGLASVSLKMDSGIFSIADDSDLVAAYQAIAGVGIKVRPDITLDVAYKYFATSDPSFEDVTGFPFDAQYKSHNFTVGMRFAF